MESGHSQNKDQTHCKKSIRTRRETSRITSRQSEKVSQIYECKYCDHEYTDLTYMVIHHALEHEVDHPVLAYYVIHLGHGLRDQERELPKEPLQKPRLVQNDEAGNDAIPNQSLEVLKESFKNYTATENYLQNIESDLKSKESDSNVLMKESDHTIFPAWKRARTSPMEQDIHEDDPHRATSRNGKSSVLADDTALIEQDMEKISQPFTTQHQVEKTMMVNDALIDDNDAQMKRKDCSFNDSDDVHTDSDDSRANRQHDITDLQKTETNAHFSTFHVHDDAIGQT